MRSVRRNSNLRTCAQHECPAAAQELTERTEPAPATFWLKDCHLWCGFNILRAMPLGNGATLLNACRTGLDRQELVAPGPPALMRTGVDALLQATHNMAAARKEPAADKEKV